MVSFIRDKVGTGRIPWVRPGPGVVRRYTAPCQRRAPAACVSPAWSSCPCRSPVSLFPPNAGLSVRQTTDGLMEILTYEIIFGYTDMNPGDFFFTFVTSKHNTRGHACKLLPSHCRVDVRKCFFAVRVAKPWICLRAEPDHFSSLSILNCLLLVLICLIL